MQNKATVSSAFAFALHVLKENIESWLNAESESFTRIVRESDDDTTAMTHKEVIYTFLGFIALMLVIGIAGNIERM